MKRIPSALALACAMSGMAACTIDQPRIFNKTAGLPELQAEHWYSIRNVGDGEAKLIEVFIYGEIGYWGVTSGDFIRDLQAQDDGVSPVLVHFDTIGGDLFDGIAIHNTLRSLGERCTGRVDGACFSAGSVAICGAHRVEMADNALMMIHNPWTWMAGGSEELRKMADMMDKAREGIIASYLHRNLTVDEAELSRMIDEETWLTPTEAKAFGFVDEILGAGEPLARNAAMGKILNRYRNTPQAALDLLATAPSEPEPEADPAPEPDPDPVALAAQLTAECHAAGLANVAPVLINACGLKSADAVQAAVNNAVAIRDLCVVAKLPGEAEQLIKDGLTCDQARAKLFDKLVAKSSTVEINNHPPMPDEPAPAANAVNPQAVYASRKPNASKGAHQ